MPVDVLLVTVSFWNNLDRFLNRLACACARMLVKISEHSGLFANGTGSCSGSTGFLVLVKVIEWDSLLAILADDLPLLASEFVDSGLVNVQLQLAVLTGEFSMEFLEMFFECSDVDHVLAQLALPDVPEAVGEVTVDLGGGE